MAARRTPRSDDRAQAYYTRGGAFVNFEEADSGSLEVGKFADLIVLDRDPYLP
ncbi:MAG: hypothetical protein R2708_27135 [Vicinamibacterales bacterium]